MIHNNTEYIVNNNTFMNLLNLLFTIMWSTLTGATIGFAIVSYIFDYNNENNQVVEEENEGEGEEEEENENDKYYQELSDLQERILSTEELENLRLNVIEEEMSNGKVIMTYNSDNETFWYYTDYKSVPYAVLDKIARLFAITYNCKSVCVNSKEELEKAEKKYEEKMVRQEEQQRLKDEKDEKDDKPKEKSVFASFKNYNTTDNKNMNNNKNKNNNNNNKNNNNKNKKNKKKNNIIPEKSNRFNYKGSLEDYIKCNQSNNIYNHNSDGTLKMDYAAFKTKLMNEYEKKKD